MRSARYMLRIVAYSMRFSGLLRGYQLSRKDLVAPAAGAAKYLSIESWREEFPGHSKPARKCFSVWQVVREEFPGA